MQKDITKDYFRASIWDWADCGRFDGVQWASAGCRSIYLLIPKPSIIYLFYAYTKGDLTDLSSGEQQDLQLLTESDNVNIE